MKKVEIIFLVVVALSLCTLCVQNVCLKNEVDQLNDQLCELKEEVSSRTVSFASTFDVVKGWIYRFDDSVAALESLARGEYGDEWYEVLRFEKAIHKNERLLAENPNMACDAAGQPVPVNEAYNWPYTSPKE